MIFFKYLLAQLLTPFSIAMAFLVAGILLLWSRRRGRLGKLLISGGVILLMVFGNSILARSAVSRLENMYPPFTQETAQRFAAPARPPDQREGASGQAQNTQKSGPVCWIVVLGTGYEPDFSRSVNNQVYDVFLLRFVEAVRLQRIMPDSRILVSVSGTATRSEKATLVRELGAMLGLAGMPPAILGDASNTFGEAKRTREIVGDTPVILVTSAIHMHRAMTVFKAAGLNITPAPTDYLAPEGGCTVSDLLIPCPNALRRWNVVFHEGIGMIYGKIRGHW